MKFRSLVIVSAGLCLSVAAHAESTEPTSTPATPTLTLDKNAMTGNVVLVWTATTGPYSVVRGTSPSFEETPPQIISAGLGATTFSDPVLTDGIGYFYSIEDANALTQVFGASANGGLPGDEITLTGIGFASVLADNEVFVAANRQW